MNKCILIGYLASDPESRTTQSGIAQCSFRLAVQRRFKSANGEREADFIPIICWRQTAENCVRYLSKGSRAAVDGSIQTRSYTAQDGTKRYVTEVIADAVEFLSTRDTGTSTAAPERTDPPHQTSFQELDIDDPELPF